MDGNQQQHKALKDLVSNWVNLAHAGQGRLRLLDGTLVTGPAAVMEFNGHYGEERSVWMPQVFRGTMRRFAMDNGQVKAHFEPEFLPGGH